MKVGFDHEKYLEEQSRYILERIEKKECDRLYLEFGGKLVQDKHAMRVLPGFDENAKIKLLAKMKDQAEIIICIYAGDILCNKTRQDFGITYDLEVMRLIDMFRSYGLLVNSVVITRYEDQPAVNTFISKLEHRGIKTYKHYFTKGYPTDVAKIVSEEGYGANPYIEVTRPLVVVNAPGPGSGKLATCLNQLYHEAKRGTKARYAKFETFPIWNLPLKHPVNIAYEAATADLNDVNMIDPFHLEAYGKVTINYNRDIEIFPVLNALFEGIYGENPYKSPTDMGVNMVGFCMNDEDVCCNASRDEIIRRYYTALNDLANGACNESEVNKLKIIMQQAKLTTDYRRTTVAAHARRDMSESSASAIELPDGTVITASESSLLGPSAALLINATKHLAGISHDVKLIPQEMIEPIQRTKVDFLHGHNPRLHTDEVLVALSLLSTKDENCRLALEQLPNLNGCQVHSTVMLSEVDRKVFKKLGIGLTCDPVRTI